jgi:lipopolysaccharide biosynthesis glycosyltransferase
MVDRRCDRLDRTAALSLRAWVKAAKIADDAPLFNAGVLVMDLAALRQDARLEKVREVMSRCALDDQDGLCLLAGGRFQALERRWNHLAAMDSIERPAVIHWAGVHKPWTHLGTPLEEVWWTEARRLYDEGRLVWPLPRLDGRARWTEEL